tara:strand:+ start:301 stop:576 length:276 start_codon:yes stop_codon:yes gene_type:complete
MGLFNLRKNKRYSYSRIFSKDSILDKKNANLKKIKFKFDEYRLSTSENNSFREKFRNANEDSKAGNEKSVRNRLILNFILLLIGCLLFFLI